jgi:hypothetical protein
MQDTQTTAIHLIRSSTVCWNKAEPGLNEMLADPMTQLLMRRDGVQEAEIRRLAARLRQRMAASVADDSTALPA